MTRLGVIGLGAAAQAFLTPLRRHPDFTIVAACDPRAEARAEFAAAFDVPVFDTVDDLLRAGLCEAVYIGTPTELHRDHAMAALEAGQHVLLEKPMCIRAEDGIALAQAAEARGLALVVGHSHSHDLPIRKMREIIRSGRLGAVRMVNTWCYTDWVYRPRRPDELRPELGGGVTYRQGAHQFDILRSLCGERVVSVTGHAFDFDPARPTIGAHSATLTFANGAIGTAVYNGYGHFATSELTGQVGEWGYPATVKPRAAQAAASPEEELKRKRERAKSAIGNDAPHQPHFGLTLVSCEKGDIRQSPDGLLIYTAEGCETLPLDNSRSPRELVLDEFAAAIGGEPPLHDGYWGASIVSVCDAVLDSARSGKPVAIPQS
ncbi:Gfo/Idh/MocA family oxidoreductase [Sinisalibacter aestuarii]|uniref:Dehydrogenase n=1 Tax=Sinisalibacter aestuarii TaxID=2949426 RepID=A0ABQ5M0C8_9RHOB|nr:Gfo/Idh/MocA family oxidoreductase [Sinisalibacter aestuarii]GKY90116.1 dehydrogenase [Sinisalibacter aestuarii]